MTVRAGILLLLEALDRTETPYMVVGSTASSIYGFFRATADVDVVVDLRPEHAAEFAELLSGHFYVDPGKIREALRTGRSFNVIHLASSYKFDLFARQRDAYSAAQFERRQQTETSIFGGDPIELSLCAPEDIVLGKLRWYEHEGRVSDRHWNDILGVISTQRRFLDLVYLREWAKELKLGDLLESALTESRER